MPKSDHPKNIFWNLIYIVLAVTILLGLSWSYTLWKQGKSLAPARTITVSADGKTMVAPDIASFSFSVVSEGTDPEKLADDNVKKINTAINFVKSEGVEADDIKTANYNLSPRYEYDEKRRRTFISGYTLTQTIFVKIRDFSKIGKIIGALPGLGINDINSLSFDIENLDVHLADARQEAFDKARVKARFMAAQAGVRLKGVVTFSEFSGGFPRPLPFAALGKGGFGGDGPVPSIEPGSQEATVQVSVTYEIR